MNPDPDNEAANPKTQPRSKLELKPDVRLDRDPNVESLLQARVSSSERVRSHKQMPTSSSLSSTRQRATLTTQTSFGQRSSMTSSTRLAPCVICHHIPSSTSLTKDQLGTFNDFVEQFQFQPHFRSLFGHSKGRRLVVIGKICKDCAASVKAVCELNVAIEIIQRQIKNTISNIVDKVKWKAKKTEDEERERDEGGDTFVVGNSATEAVRGRRVVTQQHESPAMQTVEDEEDRIDELGVKTEPEDVAAEADNSEVEVDIDSFVPISCIPDFDCLEFDDGDGIEIEISPENPTWSDGDEETTEGLEQSHGDEFSNADDNDESNVKRRSLRPRTEKRKPYVFDLDSDVDDDNDFESEDASSNSDSDSNDSSAPKTRRERKPPRSTKTAVVDKICKENPTLLPCQHCGSFWRSRRNLKTHMASMHRDKLTEEEMRELKCSVCGKSFPFVENRIAHEINWCKVAYNEEELKNAEVTMFKCTEVDCSLVFPKIQDFKAHLGTHVVVPSYNRSTKVSRSDKDKVDDRPPLSNACSVCGKQFTALRVRLVHEFNVCGVPFDEEKLKEELNGRSKVQLAKCSYPGCDLVCYNGYSLQRHYQVHTGEQPYACRYCGKSFGHTSSRREHELSVCNPNPDPSAVAKVVRRHAKCREMKKSYTLSCPYEGCTKKFLNQGKLNLHFQKFHGTEHPTMETSSMCDVCGNTFPCDTSLRIHVRRAHEVIRTTNFPCLLRSSSGCEERFSSLEDRRRHMAEVHGRVKVHKPRIRTSKKKKIPKQPKQE